MKIKITFGKVEKTNVLRCPFCGAGILTKADNRSCYKCNTLMKLETVLKNGKPI